MTHTELVDTLEKLVDGASLSRVVEALATVAQRKAEHITQNWQDKDLAKRWEICATALDSANRRIRTNVGE